MKIKIFITLLILLVVSCGGLRTTVSTKDYNGFIKFVGNTNGITVVIDNNEPFQLELKTEAYELKPGKYQIKIYRNEILIVDRLILIDKQITTEIEVP